jgi:hypothetical protein
LVLDDVTTIACLGITGNDKAAHKEITRAMAVNLMKKKMEEKYP